MSSAICFNLDQSKILSFGNGLKQWHIFILKICQMIRINHHLSPSRENTDACSPLIPNACGPQKTLMFHFYETTD